MSAPRVGEKISSDVARARVLDRAGVEHALGDEWKSGPCLLVFLRHFGCVGCSEHVTALSPRLLELAALDVRAVFIGNGAPSMIDGFVERQALADKKVTLLTDPSLTAYRAAGFARSKWSTLGPRALVDSARALLAGHPHLSVQGDAFQQGGTLLVDRDGVVCFFHQATSLGDHPSPSDVVDSAMRVRARESQYIV